MIPAGTPAGTRVVFTDATCTHHWARVGLGGTTTEPVPNWVDNRSVVTVKWDGRDEVHSIYLHRARIGEAEHTCEPLRINGEIVPWGTAFRLTRPVYAEGGFLASGEVGYLWAVRGPLMCDLHFPTGKKYTMRVNSDRLERIRA